jgi:hypothetical protein
MAAATHNVIIDQGADWRVDVVYKDPDGVPINLSNYTAQLQLRTSYEASSASLNLTSSSGITITANSGRLAIHATATQTNALAAGDYVYDLEINLSGFITRLIQGRATVRPQVTR